MRTCVRREAVGAGRVPPRARITPPPLLPFPETQARRVHAEEESAKAEEHLKRIGGHIKDGFA